MEDFYSDVVIINENDVEWLIYMDHQGIAVKGYYNFINNMPYNVVYGFIHHDLEFIFDMFKKYANKTLDTTKYSITFPNVDAYWKDLKIKDDTGRYCYTLTCVITTNDLLLLRMHINVTRSLQNKVKQLEEQVANLNDKLDILGSFVDLAIDSNKKTA